MYNSYNVYIYICTYTEHIIIINPQHNILSLKYLLHYKHKVQYRVLQYQDVIYMYIHMYNNRGNFNLLRIQSHCPYLDFKMKISQYGSSSNLRESGIAERLLRSREQDTNSSSQHECFTFYEACIKIWGLYISTEDVRSSCLGSPSLNEGPARILRLVRLYGWGKLVEVRTERVVR